MQDLRIMIAGSRTYNNYDELKTIINGFITAMSIANNDTYNIIIVSGKAKGADTLGEQYANEYRYNIEEYPAKWKDLNAQPCKIKYNQYGAYNCLAGMNRNKDMVNASDIVFMFHDGKSSGTAHDLKLAKQYNKQYVYINYNDYNKNETNVIQACKILQKMVNNNVMV